MTLGKVEQTCDRIRIVTQFSTMKVDQLKKEKWRTPPNLKGILG